MSSERASKRGVTSPVDPSKSLDDESRAMIFEGVNISQMCQMFRLDSRTVVKRIYGLAPCGRRGHADIYALHEVMPRMWKPSAEQVARAIREMNHADLPKALTKEYWAGQRARQEYELRRGDLWPTEKIIQEVGEMLKLVKMTVLLHADAVERQTELTNQQRVLIRQMSRSLLDDLDEKMKKTFQAPPPDTYGLPPQQSAPQQPDDDDDSL